MRRRPLMALSCLVIAWIVLWNVRLDPSALETLDGRPARICGQVIRIDETDGGLRLLAALTSGDFEEGNGSSEGYITQSEIIQASAIYRILPVGRTCIFIYPEEFGLPQETAGELKAGDWVIAEGTVSIPQGPTNPGEFDQRQYYLEQGVTAVLTESKIEAQASDQSRYTWTQRIRDRTRQHFLAAAEEEDAACLQAILTGDRSLMDRDLKQLFDEGGMAHILSVSGLHIQLLGMAVYRLLRMILMVPAAGIGSIIAVIGYCLLAGAAVSSRRALTWFVISMGARMLGRRSDRATSLALCLALILLQSPRSLCGSALWVSFGCSLSIRLLGGPLSRQLRRRFSRRTAEAIAASLAVWAGTSPLIAWFYYQLVPGGVLLNILTLPLLTVLLPLGAATAVMHAIHPAMGTFMAGACHVILWIVRSLCRIPALLPGGVVITGRPALWQMAVYYLQLALLVRRLHGPGSAVLLVYRRRRLIQGGSAEAVRTKAVRTKAVRQRRCLMLMMLLPLMIIWRPPAPDRIMFLDVGQGDCILIQTRAFTCMVDCGNTFNTQVWEYKAGTVLKYYGIRHLDAVFATHGDEDHINGIQGLLEDLQISWMGTDQTSVMPSQLVIAQGSERYDEKLQELAALAEDKQIPVIPIRPGQGWEADGYRLVCLYPSQDELITHVASRNECSLVLMLSVTHRNETTVVLLTGDLEKDGEISMLQDLPLDEIAAADRVILKAGHHGSRNATGEALLELLKPDIAVISCGKNNVYGHPAPEVLERLTQCGSEIRRTDEEGAVLLGL